MEKLEIKRNTAQGQGFEVVIYPKQKRLNGNAILSKGLAAVYRQKALAKGIDLERLIGSTNGAAVLDQDDLRAIFVPAVDLDTQSVDFSAIDRAVAEAVFNGIRPVIVYWWDEESRRFAEALHDGENIIARYNAVEAFRNRLELQPTWPREDSVFITVNPRLRVKMEVAEAFVRSMPQSVLVTIARVSNLPFIQAAKAAGKRVIVLDPGLTPSWREETKALLEGAEVIRTAETYTPGAVTATVRSVLPTVAKAFGIEPPGLRSEAGLVPTNLWEKVKTFSYQVEPSA
ncbi:hypothetical protein G20c_59 [Thermus phage G20c]|nr:hypothetical protein G20c_59 [Thermus phage G20c]